MVCYACPITCLSIHRFIHPRILFFDAFQSKLQRAVHFTSKHFRTHFFNYRVQYLLMFFNFKIKVIQLEMHKSLSLSTYLLYTCFLNFFKKSTGTRWSASSQHVLSPYCLPHSVAVCWGDVVAVTKSQFPWAHCPGLGGQTRSTSMNK